MGSEEVIRWIMYEIKWREFIVMDWFCFLQGEYCLVMRYVSIVEQLGAKSQ